MTSTSHLAGCGVKHWQGQTENTFTNMQERGLLALKSSGSLTSLVSLPSHLWSLIGIFYLFLLDSLLVYISGHKEAEFMCVCDIIKENRNVIEDLNKAQVQNLHEFKCFASVHICNFVRLTSFT